jgi:uncharacterized delta-60 repeat protein
MSRGGRRSVGLAVAAALVLVGVSAAAPGDLDPSFGGDGVVITPIAPGSAWDLAEAVAPYPGGRLVAAGFSVLKDGRGRYLFALARYHADGSLDATFGEDGRVSMPATRRNSRVHAIVVDSDGRLVVGGSGRSRDFALARYRPDGSLDPSFGGDGVVLTSVGAFDQVDALVVQDDGRLVAAGWTEGGRVGDAFALARYHVDGTLDTSFAGDGVVRTRLSGGTGAHALVLQDDGKLVVAGSGGSRQNFALARYNPDGSLDASFGVGGIVHTEMGDSSDARALVLQPDGKLVAAGWADDRSSPMTFALARYQADGSLDSSFGDDGTVRTQVGITSDVEALVLQPDGKLVAGGRSEVEQPWSFDFALARYRPDGTLDSSFGGDGIVTTAIGTGFERINALLLDENSRVVAAGEAEGLLGGYDFALARYER